MSDTKRSSERQKWKKDAVECSIHLMDPRLFDQVILMLTALLAVVRFGSWVIAKIFLASLASLSYKLFWVVAEKILSENKIMPYESGLCMFWCVSLRTFNPLSELRARWKSRGFSQLVEWRLEELCHKVNPSSWNLTPDTDCINDIEWCNCN